MNHQPLVGVLNGGADLQEQFEAFGNSEPVVIAVLGKRLTFDQLHYEVRYSFVSRTAVEQLCDVGMIEAGQDLAFIFEAVKHEAGVLPGAHEFERDILLILGVGTACAIDLAHATGSDLLGNAVRTDTPPDPQIFSFFVTQ